MENENEKKKIKTDLQNQNRHSKQRQKDKKSWRVYTIGQGCTSSLPLSFLLLCYQLCLASASSSSLDAGVCLGEQQRQVFSSLPVCQARPALVGLRTAFNNHSQVMQVMPDHVAVDRCGGSCYGPAHTCSPTIKSLTIVQVMLVLSKWPHGEHETLCSEVEVEVHEQCECGCRIQRDQCLPGLQYYHQSSCR